MTEKNESEREVCPYRKQFADSVFQIKGAFGDSLFCENISCPNQVGYSLEKKRGKTYNFEGDGNLFGVCKGKGLVSKIEVNLIRAVSEGINVDINKYHDSVKKVIIS